MARSWSELTNKKISISNRQVLVLVTNMISDNYSSSQISDYKKINIAIDMELHIMTALPPSLGILPEFNTLCQKGLIKFSGKTKTRDRVH